MTVRVGINGFGRVGRSFVRAVHQQDADVEVVAANDLGSLEQMAHLLRFDSVFGRFSVRLRQPPGRPRGHRRHRAQRLTSSHDTDGGQGQMDALVVFESMFGNTKAVAEAIADGLSAGIAVELLDVDAAPVSIDTHVGLLVVGGPTHAFGLSRPRTRDDAARQAGRAPVAAGIGLREWIAMLVSAPPGLAVACFDTRSRRPRLPGSAARAAAKRLQRRGFTLAALPESFWVTGTKGPLVDGELERGRLWGEKLLAAVRAEP